MTNVEKNAFFNCYNVDNFTCQGEMPPVCADSSLWPIPENHATLYVPKGCSSKYQAVEPWSKFEHIVEQEWERCEPPTITYDNKTKKLIFMCATEGAKIHYTIECEDAQSNEEEEIYNSTVNRETRSGESNTEIQLTGVYTIKAYAFNNVASNSEETKARLYVVNDNFENTDIADIRVTRGIVVSKIGDMVNISGTIGGETIRVYDIAGILVKEFTAHEGSTTFNGLRPGNVYVVKIGNAKVKVSL